MVLVRPLQGARRLIGHITQLLDHAPHMGESLRIDAAATVDDARNRGSANTRFPGHFT